MKDSKVTVIALLFALFCFALIGGVYFLGEKLKTQHEEYDDLAQRKANLNADTNNLIQQKKVFTEAFAELSNYHVNPADGEVPFYSEVQQAVQNNSIEILSTRQQPRDKDSISRVSMTLRGDYYNFMNVLAAWRNLPMTVRVSTLTIRSDNAQSGGRSGSSANDTPTGIIQADVTVEAVIAAAQ